MCVYGPTSQFFPKYAFHSIYVPDLRIAPSSRYTFHFMVTFGSIIAHLLRVSRYPPMMISLALRRSHGYPIVIHLHDASVIENSFRSIRFLIKSVISSSPLGERGSVQSSSKMLLLSFRTQMYARFPWTGSLGFSTIHDISPSWLV